MLGMIDWYWMGGWKCWIYGFLEWMMDDDSKAQSLAVFVRFFETADSCWHLLIPNCLG